MAPRARHRWPRSTAAFLACSLIVAACGGGDSPDEATQSAIERNAQALAATGADGGDVTIAPAPTAPPRPTPSPIDVPETVEVRFPELLVEPPAGQGQPKLLDVLTIPGVDHLAGVARVDATLESQAGSRPISILAVDPTSFRPLTPAVTANVRAVWERLHDGDVLVRHDVAHEMGLQLGGDALLVGQDGTAVTVRIGAFASNGAPPLADVVVPWSVGRRVGAAEVNLLVVSVAETVGSAETGEAIKQTIGGGEITVRERPEERQAQLRGNPTVTRFEPFSYVDLGDGLIVIDRAWVQRWIVSVDLPSLGRTSCHRLVVPQLFKALEEIHAAGLHEHFDPGQFAGCWVPRHIDWDPRKPLSMHAWGLAVDINSRDNCLGCQPQMHPGIVEIFERWGFAWGGRWERPDGMHFELRTLIDVG